MQEVYIGIQGLFALAVVLVEDGIHLISNFFITEMGVVGNDGLESVVEHNGRFEEVTASAYPFGGPDGTDDMRVPEFAGVAVDDIACRCGEVCPLMGCPIHGQKDMMFQFRMRRYSEEYWTPDLQIVVEDRHKFGRKRQVEDIGFPLSTSNFELFTAKGDTPCALWTFMKIFSKEHFPHVALAVGNIGPEIQHKRITGVSSTLESGMLFLRMSVAARFRPRPDRVGDLPQSREGYPGLVLVQGWRRKRDRFLERDNLGCEVRQGSILPYKGRHEIKEMPDSQRWLPVTVIHMPMNVASHEINIKEVLKGWSEVEDVVEIPKIPFEGSSVVIKGFLTLAQMGWSSWDKRSCRPGVKGKKIGLECWRPLSKRQIGLPQLSIL